MGLFDIFGKGKKDSPSTTDNGILGPTYFDGITEQIVNPVKLESIEWRRKLKTKLGQNKFQIKYYGELHQDYKNLIVGTDFAPAKIFAVGVTNGNEILLFDGCNHGYNSMFCVKYSNDQINNRIAEKIYTDKTGNDQFEIVISTLNGIDYEDEFRDEVDENGNIELINGLNVEFNIVKRNGFDSLQIWLINKSGIKTEIVSEELA